ncbi:Uncharacterized protein (Fragment) [Durusdinium trenchii]|uniref:Ubiquitin-like domain-containing protein n=1 Tax=Durusdinium trenchii TaxID=1381693 RepID=A0ABP0M1X7_9DINO
MVLSAVVANLAGDELCQVDVPLNSKASDVKVIIAQELGMSPYTFKLITIVSGMTLEGNDGSVSHLADNGRLDLTLVKIDGIPSPDPYGYLQLQTKGETTPRSITKRYRLVMTMVILLLVAFVASFFSFPHGLLVWYVIYLLEALFFNPTAKGLMRLKQTDSILDYIEEIKVPRRLFRTPTRAPDEQMMVSKTHDADEQIACRPAPEVNAQCYHMETRTRTVTGKDGTRTEVYQERVDTARLTERLRVARWADDTGEVVDGLSYFPLLQVHFDLKWEAADPETHRAHEQQREALRARAHAADSQHDTSEELRLIDEHGQECPFYADMIGTTGEAFPVWLGYLPYAVACFLFLSWPYRYFLSQHAVKGDFVFEKRSLAEKFENAVRALQEAQKEKVSAIQAANDQAWEINKEAKEIDESRAKKEMRLTLMKESSKITDTSCQEFRTLPLREKPRSPWLVLKRNALDKDLEDLNAGVPVLWTGSRLNVPLGFPVPTLAKLRIRSRWQQRDTDKAYHVRRPVWTMPSELSSLPDKDSVLETLPPLEVNKKETEEETAR